MKNEKRGNKSGILISLSLVLFVIAIVMAATSVTKTVAEDKKVLAYSEISSIDYKVYTKPELALEKEYFGKGEVYDASFISNIVAHYDYSFLADNKLDIEYKYNIEAILTATRNGEEVINKKYSLLADEEEKVKKMTGFKISEIIDIDFNTYNQILLGELAYQNLEEFDCKIDVILNVQTNSEILDKKIDSSTKTLLSIPLLKNNFKIDETHVKDYQEVLTQVDEIIKNKKLLTCSILMACIAGVILIIAFINFLVNPNSYGGYKSEYRKVKKMVKDYDEIIKRTYKMPSMKDKKVQEVGTIDEFMTLQEKYDLPMTMVEKEDYVVFVIMTNSKAWTYSIKKLGK